MKWFIYSLFLTFSIITIQAQTDSTSICFAFYNVENFFDPDNDSLKNDDSYTFDGINRWTYSKMIHKRNQISKVILAMNGWSPPDVVGFAEVENGNLLKNLCFQTGLKKYNYNYIHIESPDLRGIDVAFIYRMDRVIILESHAIPIHFPFDTVSKNRDILYVKVQLFNHDTIHFFINHWTSRFGGFGATVKKRNHYAFLLKQQVDSIFKKEPNAAIVIMGDFNDYPTNESIKKVLKTVEVSSECSNLVNLMEKYKPIQNIGTHKNEEFWGCLDQIIVSSNFFQETSTLQIDVLENNIFKEDFLLVSDEKYGGIKTFRTYEGVKYKGGFSDHLPVYVRIKIKKQF